MKTRDILITVTRILPGWHVYNDHQFGRITAFDPQAGYEVTVNLPDSDTISIVRTRYELVEDNTVLDTADMGEEQALDELARLLASPMPRTDRLMRLKDKFEKTAEWCRSMWVGADVYRAFGRYLNFRWDTIREAWVENGSGLAFIGADGQVAYMLETAMSKGDGIRFDPMEGREDTVRLFRLLLETAKCADIPVRFTGGSGSFQQDE